MNTSLTAYTPLETLLLFQSLKTHGVDAPAFGKVSDLLKQNRHVREAAQYDGGRLHPDALQSLYYRLIRDEANSTGERSNTSESEVTNGDHSVNFKKRKAPTPAIPTVESATRDRKLIPKLIENLYARYRAQVTEEIREEERKWSKLKREVEDIESGKWDHKVTLGVTNGQYPTVKPEAGSSTSISPALRVPQVSAPPANPQIQDAHAVRPSKSPSVNASTLQPRPIQPNLAPSAHQNSARLFDPATDRYAQSTISPGPTQPNQQRLASQHIQPNSPGLPPAQAAQHQQAPLPHSKTPSATPPPQPLQSKPQPPPVISPSPGQHQLQRSPYSGDGPFNAPVSRYPHLPPQQQAQAVQSGPNQFPQPPTASSQQPRQQHMPLQPSSQPSHTGGRMLPPFQVNPQGLVQTPPQQQVPAAVATPPPRRTSKTPSSVPARLPMQIASKSLRDEVVSILRTPLRLGPLPTRPATAVNTPNSETRWKASFKYTGPPMRSPSVSPINDLAPPPIFQPPKPKPRGRPSRLSKQQKQIDDLGGEDTPVKTTRRRGRPKRGTSVTSSAMDGSARGRTRSQSVTSHTDAVSVDGSTLAQHVKYEPSTPGMSEDVMPGIESQMSGPTRRSRGAALHAGTSKRKREASETAESEDLPGTHQIVAPRYFSRMSAPLMNDVTSHKYASLFSHPVKEKDAEGYKDIIRRPQDLKSIRTAISAGAKAVAAAASAETPSGNSPGGAGGNVLLNPSAEVMPPRAIVNSAQLERELVRMFANAVMFNSGEEGVVQDSRDMYESVQQAVSNWRSAERTEDNEEVNMEDETAGLPKRRKI